MKLAAYSIVKNVKGETGRNFRKNGVVVKNSYGLAPPDPPVPSSIRSLFGLPNLSPEVGAASLPGSTVVPFPQDCCQGFFLPAVYVGRSWQTANSSRFISSLFCIKQSLCQLFVAEHYCLLISKIGFSVRFLVRLGRPTMGLECPLVPVL